MSNPEKLAKQGKYKEAAQLYLQKANDSKNLFERRRYFDFAARCYESSSEYASAIFCFLEADNLQATINTCIKSRNPKHISQALIQRGKVREAVRPLIICSLNFLRERSFIDAQNFCEEALGLCTESQLPEALMNIIIGAIEDNQEKIINGLKICHTITGDNFDLVSEITFIGKNLLSEMPPVQISTTQQVIHRDRKKVEACPYCNAPFPQQKSYSKVIKCDYCGHITKSYI